MLAIIVMGQNRVDAASWGAKNLFTTPKETRGTWYYKQEGKIKKLKITTHTFNKIKLYKMLSSNQAIKWTKKLAKTDKKSVPLNTKLLILNFIKQQVLLPMVGFLVIELIQDTLMLL
ncbi:MAG: hypothetical protein N4R47_04375 [Lactobacillus crispatus]|nr:hypothetical protein [Lactobacillus crispatus]